MKTYHIHRAGDREQLGEITVKVVDSSPSTGQIINEYYLSPKESQEVHNHSPDGFEFGYGGSGPAQLALAILMDYTGKIPTTRVYQAFKFKFIGSMQHPGGTIGGLKIEDFINQFKPEERFIAPEELE